MASTEVKVCWRAQVNSIDVSNRRVEMRATVSMLFMSNADADGTTRLEVHKMEQEIVGIELPALCVCEEEIFSLDAKG